MCVVIIIIRSDFFWTKGPDFNLLFISLTPSTSTYLFRYYYYTVESVFLYILSERVPARSAAVYYIIYLHYYDCCYYTMFSTRV